MGFSYGLNVINTSTAAGSEHYVVFRQNLKMTIEAEIISQPYSGQYIERIYNNVSTWNSQSWTFIKFTDEDYAEWCGHFRGSPRQISVSTINNTILVLTSDYLYQLDRSTADLIELEDQPPYHNLTVAPNGNFILADYNHLEKVTTSIRNKELIDSPINMDTEVYRN